MMPFEPGKNAPEFFMNGTFEFAWATSALLLSLGPTNMLMALAGMRAGWAGSFGRITAELVAYLVIAVPLVWIGAPIFERWPEIGRGVQLAAALWVGWLAIALWFPSKTKEGSVSV